MTRILVTGASGFIGRHVVEAASRRGHEIVALVRNTRTYRAPRRSVVPVAGDVRDPESVRSAMKGCHAVIHLAALYTFDSTQRKVMREVNVEGTENVLRMALEAGVDRIVYTGTVGGTAFSTDGLATERDVAGPETMKGPYKRSKFEAERVVRQMAKQGAPVVTVCPTAPLGPGDEKPTPTGDIVRRFMRRRMPAYVDTGLNFVHVRDVAEGHLLALERGELGGRYPPWERGWEPDPLASVRDPLRTDRRACPAPSVAAHGSLGCRVGERDRRKDTPASAGNSRRSSANGLDPNVGRPIVEREGVAYASDSGAAGIPGGR